MATERRSPSSDTSFSPLLRVRTSLFFLLNGTHKEGLRAIVTLTGARRESPLQSAPRAHYARFCRCTHIQGAFLLRRGIITRGGLLVLLPASSATAPSLPSLFSSSSSSTAIIHRDRCAPIYLYRNAPARRGNLERSG